MNLRIYDHAQIAQRRLLEREQAYAESVADDLGEELSLPGENAAGRGGESEEIEQASVNTQISDSNVGFRLLQKMGWKGKGLGKDEQGIVEPIRADSRDPKLGVGKQEEDDFYTAEASIHRKKMESETSENDEETAKKREVEAERELKIQSEVKEIRKVFFCELCNKQYKFAVEFETHLSSYDHNHRKRFKEMRDLHSSRDRDDRQKREQLRLDKEMAKRQAEAQRQQQEQQSDAAKVIDAPPPDSTAVSTAISTAAAAPVPGTVKFGFSSRAISTKVLPDGAAAKKLKVFAKVPSVFGEDSD
ncbi:G patch domain-containing protein 8 [Selaginella moellendorffii]|uniref:G patch domain-containing protein 8 n=1 Tax=Selaginella moellendorffii TaxID=88036 RepID=UPI000D1C5333|nr:G patch domain-containing protein 8 isoform X1 [Selaginella moellendorffii]XP_024543538.1 G patch domain-containing protein 8 [Selaginella moellendorffii]|eukprot:XP_024541746.1 G patch domain-containing protein 8 isoform X1 [Selaginella moellendorffii]